jgi:group II intron reverse transcriptase/maturase
MVGNEGSPRTHRRKGVNGVDEPVKGNAAIRRGRATVSTELDRISSQARKDGKMQFFSIAHLLTEEALGKAFKSLRKDASAGVDEVTHQEYGRNAESNIQDLHKRMREGRYRAQPLRRIYIPKENGKERPISIPSLEDKIAQKATATLLNAIYEVDFLECSYGFREGRDQHDALDEVRRILCDRPVHYVLEADIVGYFDAIVRSHLMEMIEKRVRDGSILKLIGKWIHVGAIEDGVLLLSETGTGQGQVISPLLANIYLHYVLDLWIRDEVRSTLEGEMHEVRYADDFLLFFQHQEDAQRVLESLRNRFEGYGLTLHPEKTRLIEFGPRSLREAARPGGQGAATFDFLGFTHVPAKGQRGSFTVHLRTMRKRLSRALSEIRAWCADNRHKDVEGQRKTLNQKLRGHYQYYGRATNYYGIYRFYRTVRTTWKKSLGRRGSEKRFSWALFDNVESRYPLQQPRITRTWQQMVRPRRGTEYSNSVRSDL